MNISFHKLFSVRVDHPFYGGPQTGIQFIPFNSTRRVLEGGKLLARERNGILHVMFEAQENGEPIVRLAGAQLHFAISMRDPNFTNFTVLPAGFPERKLYFDNRADPNELAPGNSVAVLPTVFSYTPSSSARPVIVSLRDAAGRILTTDTLAESDPRSSLSFDLRHMQPGRIELREQFTGSTRTMHSYLAADAPLDLAGIIEIQIADGFYDAPADFVLSFTSREQVLRYYVVARNYSQQHFNQLNVRDTGFNDENRPQIQFQRIPAASFTANELPPSVLAPLPDQRVALFRSTAPVPRTARARRNIQLVRQNDVLIENLPQPSAGMAQAELVIHVSNPLR